MIEEIFKQMRWRLAGALSGGFILILLVMLWGMLNWAENNQMDNQKATSRLIAGYLSELAAEEIVAEDWPGLEHMLEKYQKLLNSGYIIVEDFSEKTVSFSYAGQYSAEFHPDSLEVNPKEQKSFFKRNLEEGEEVISFFDYRFPIRDGLLGFVRVGIPERELQANINKKNIFIWIIFLFGIFLAIICTVFIVTLMVSRPLGRLIAEAYRISMGQLNQPVSGSENGELQQLTSSLERIRLSLKLAMDRLKK